MARQRSVRIRRRFLDSIRRRLVLLVVAALAPIVLANVIQAYLKLEQDRGAARDHMLQAAVGAARQGEIVLAGAEQILSALQNLPEIRDRTEGCSASLTSAKIGISYAANIARLDSTGRVVCAALPQTLGLDQAGQSWWQNVNRNDRFFISNQRASDLAVQEMLIAALPMRTATGAPDGALALAIKIDFLQTLLQWRSLPEQPVVALTDATGAVIVSNDHKISEALFRGGRPGEAELANGADSFGNTWVYVTAPLRENDIFVGLAVLQRNLFANTRFEVATYLVLPIIMVSLSSLAIWLGVDWLVLRWLVYLRRITVAYAHGHYGLRPTRLSLAAGELRLLGDAVDGMVEAIRERDRKLRGSVEEMAALNREIHHRIKNNLQLMMSLLSLQASRTDNDAVRLFVRDAQLRIHVLALVHALLHEGRDGSVVEGTDLLTRLASQIEGDLGLPRGSVTVASGELPAQLRMDDAVALTILIAELLIVGHRHCRIDAALPTTMHIEIEAAPAGGHRLVMSGRNIDIACILKVDEVTTELIEALAGQLMGKAFVATQDDAPVIAVEVKLRSAEGEAKASPQTEA